MKKTDKQFNAFNLARTSYLVGTAAIIAIVVVASIVIWPAIKTKINADHDKVLSIKLREVDPLDYALGVYRGWLDLKKNTLILIEEPSDDSPKANNISYYDNDNHLLVTGSKNSDRFFFHYLKPNDSIWWETEIFTYKDLMSDDKLIHKGKTLYKGKAVHQLDTKAKQYDSDPNDGKSDGPEATYYLDIKTKLPIVKITDPLNISGMSKGGQHRIEILGKIVEKGSLNPKIFTLFDIKKIKNKIVNFSEYKSVSKTKSDVKKVLAEDLDSTFSNIDSLYYLGAQFELNDKSSDLDSVTVTRPATISFNYAPQMQHGYDRSNDLEGYKFDINFTPLRDPGIIKKWEHITADHKYAKQNIKGDEVYIKANAAFLVKDANLISIAKSPNDADTEHNWDYLKKPDLIALIKNLKKFE